MYATGSTTDVQVRAAYRSLTHSVRNGYIKRARAQNKKDGKKPSANKAAVVKTVKASGGGQPKATAAAALDLIK
jgi:hypothetical protein